MQEDRISKPYGKKKIERSIECENAKIQKSDPGIPDLSLCL